ncbi:pantothenate kinase [Pullulanibacillus camelliae]|uniref:Pantothenate kinase n=1 Tax=Pullulanibacillus camelliae TaxID=1707096 RepID=A0A8J2YI89_9BACL|nr:type I pantothenate kinase [Pullulanibacillus camelliae]GGE44660.1 pantothenate kinase [Pullulanibacillus camelliae]
MPYIVFDRPKWSTFPHDISIDEKEHFSTMIAEQELSDIYNPLGSLLLRLYTLHQERSTALEQFFHQDTPAPKPFIIGIAGSVAAGKSTFANTLIQLLTAADQPLKATVLSTDHFLFPNHVLKEGNMMDLKGFPESYDWDKLIHALHQIKLGKRTNVPIYSHETYDILDHEQTIEKADIIIVEGINTLQYHSQAQGLPKLLDVTIYLDAEERDLFQWFWKRISELKKKAEQDPTSYYHAFKEKSEAELLQLAQGVWDKVNGRNLYEHILPTRSHADIIIKKRSDHTIENIKIRDTFI